MNNGSILYVPVQINGDGDTTPKSLKDRELYVLDNGTLYVGRKQTDGSVKAITVAGRVVDGAEIANPTLSGDITLGKGVITNNSTGKLHFVDEGQFPLDSPVGEETLSVLVSDLMNRVATLEEARSQHLSDTVESVE